MRLRPVKNRFCLEDHPILSFNHHSPILPYGLPKKRKRLIESPKMIPLAFPFFTHPSVEIVGCFLAYHCLASILGLSLALKGC